jgi:hypothetical protein
VKLSSSKSGSQIIGQQHTHAVRLPARNTAVCF